MTLPILTELWLGLVLTGMFFLPGTALLFLSGSRQQWVGLQKYILAIGLSVAFYPVLFYGVRFLLPQVTLGPYKMGLIILLAVFIVGWGWWQQRSENTRKLDGLEWAALGIIALTVVSRLWLAHNRPFPAWSDSLHHTLLTQLTAQRGQIPYSLEPYFPNLLDMYHLGLYAISGTAAMLAQVPAHSALLWTAQFLNIICGLGVYLVLDRYVGRAGAVVGLAVVSLVSTHPALWVNWGRFTQLASLSILLIAWVLTLETIGLYQQVEQSVKSRLWLVLFSSLCTASLFLLHFRVAIFYLPLLAISVVYGLWRAKLGSQRRDLLKWLVVVGVLSLLIVFPVLWDATAVYLSKSAASGPVMEPAQKEELLRSYYVFPLSTIPHLAAPVWLLVGTTVASLLGFVRRNAIIITAFIWTILLTILGNLYILNIPILSVTNFGAILIMFYMPMGLILGAGVTESLRLVPLTYRKRVTAVLITLILIASFPAAYARATTIEPERHFVTPQDIVAMNWINDNIPAEATFAINTYFWLPNFAHGTDAGYWIPYWTGRHIVTSSMLSDGLSAAYREQVRLGSNATEALETDLSALDELYEMGITYIYIGANGDFTGTGLQSEFLLQSDRVELLYENDDVTILHILSKDDV